MARPTETADPADEPQPVAVIPARGGSKRIPHKNIRPLGGKPLLAYTVTAAVDSGLFAHVFVSTDSPAVAAAAEASGAQAFRRDPSLADDHTPASSATLEVVAALGLADRQPVAQLLPNCPLRTAADVRASFAAFIAGGSRAQLSVTRYGWLNPWWAMAFDGGRLEPLFSEQLKARSQDLPTLVCPTGAVWWSTAGALQQGGTFYTPDRTGFELPWQRAVDIDDEDDWRLAELLIGAQGGGA